MRQSVVVLGGSGMLGSTLTRVLSRDPDFKVTATVRSQKLLVRCAEQCAAATWRVFDANVADPETALGVIDGHAWIVNAIGITKPLVRDDQVREIERAIRINGQLPYWIASRAEQVGARVLQIATDCVYSGKKGRYAESAPHDPLDVYGKTKSLGEVPADHVSHLRCSIVGPEWKERKFLLEWLLGQPQGAETRGFTNHRWNGLTTMHFAKICGGIIRHNAQPPQRQHVIPNGELTKCELLEYFAKHYNRSDLTIVPSEAAVVLDRTLATEDEATNRKLWEAAGYVTPPTIPQMVAEASEFELSAF